MTENGTLASGLPKGTLNYWPPAEVPVQVPDTRDRSDPRYLAHFHHEFCPDLAKNGVLVPLIVQQLGDLKTLIDGETRRRGALQVGLQEVPVVLIEGQIDPADLEILKYRMNKKRIALSPMDEIRFLNDTMRAKGWSQARLCKELSLNPPLVSKQLKVFEKLIEELKPHVGEGPGKLSIRGAYAICDLPPAEQREWAAKLMNDVVCVEGVEHALRGGKRGAKPRVQKYRQKHVRVQVLTDDPAVAVTELTAILTELRRGK